MFATMTDTAADVAIIPALSVTFAVRLCVPSVTVDVLQVALYGDVVADPITVPSTMKSTRVTVTPVAAIGLAVRVTVRLTVVPGDARVTVGAAVVIVGGVVVPVIAGV
jgi:hypothetical protein